MNPVSPLHFLLIGWYKLSHRWLSSGSESKLRRGPFQIVSSSNSTVRIGSPAARGRRLTKYRCQRRKPSIGGRVFHLQRATKYVSRHANAAVATAAVITGRVGIDESRGSVPDCCASRYICHQKIGVIRAAATPVARSDTKVIRATSIRAVSLTPGTYFDRCSSQNAPGATIKRKLRIPPSPSMVNRRQNPRVPPSTMY